MCVFELLDFTDTELLFKFALLFVITERTEFHGTFFCKGNANQAIW